MKNQSKNIRITNADKVIHNHQDVETFSYMFVDFSTVEASSSNYQSYTPRQISQFMHQKQSMIFFDKIGSIGRLDPTPILPGLYGGWSYGNKKVVDESKYANYPTGFVSPNGTIIPTPIIPHGGYSEGANDRWSPTGMFKDNGDGIRRLVNTSTMNKAQTFGVLNESRHYVSNTACRTAYDNPVYCTREYAYQYDVSHPSGAFAFCYNIINHNGIGEGSGPTEASQSPCIVLYMKPNFIDPDNFTDNLWIYKNYIDQVQAGNAKNILQMKINQNSSVEVYCKGHCQRGGLPPLGQDNVPAQCLNASMEIENYPIFVYPTYAGLVFTNSVSPNQQQKNELCLSLVPKESIQSAVQINGVSKSNYISAQIKASKNELEWLPALFAESSNRSGIRLRLPSHNFMTFGNALDIRWIKSVGNFAYVPLYFCRVLRFSFFFKGAYSRDAEIKGTYYIYPIVSQSTVMGEDVSWGGVGEAGCPPIVISASRSNAYYIDDSTEEAIYRAQFTFVCNHLPRFPIEVHGAVIAYVKNDFHFKSANGDGPQFENIINEGYIPKIPKLDYTDVPLYDLMTSVKIDASLEGVTGSISLDGYPIQNELARIVRRQKVGHLELKVDSDDDAHINPHPNIFRGYGLEIGTSNSQGSNVVDITIAGIQKKMDGMKLICAPLWDGDKLELVAAYFESYMDLDIRMIDHTVSSFQNAKGVDYSTLHSTTRHHWTADGRLISGISTPNVAFRLPRSASWTNPAVNFETGKDCLSALNDLSTYCGCVFVPELDGRAYFYELNDYGFPYLVRKEMYGSNCVEFSPDEIISISVSPYLENKFNAIATFGFLVKKTSRGEIEVMQNDFLPGILYDRLDGTVFPWSKATVGTERGRLTKSELTRLHRNRIRFAKIDRYSGTLTVPGNTKIYHMYQPVKIMGNYFFVNSISHNIDLSRKEWTTTYNLQYIDTGSLNGNW